MHFTESLLVSLYLSIQCFQMHMYNKKLLLLLLLLGRFSHV